MNGQVGESEALPDHGPGLTPALELSEVQYCVHSRRHRSSRVILDGVNLRLAPGRSAAIVGPSGSGKSTILSICIGLVRPSAGAVAVVGHDVNRMTAKALARLRSDHLGMVFQSGELLPELLPIENVALPALLARRRDTAYASARAALASVGLDRDFGDAPTHALSGGERQRVAVARALINDPEVLLADEPTGSLDPDARDVVADHLFSLPSKRGCALLVVTHDREVASRADAVLELRDGRLKEIG